MNDEIYDPTVSVEQSDYPEGMEEQPETDGSVYKSEYLETLYKDYKTKINSATIYLKKLKEQEDQLDKVVHTWTSYLHDKYQILDNFQKSRPRTTVPGDFALEDRSKPIQTSDGDLKMIDSKITDSSEQINWGFGKLENNIKFLSQTFLDAQDTINKIYDRYMEIYDNM
jgi:hypothetical protein